ncbi:chaperonin 10-like protein [Amanita rubescens]|nr:chaperonin 10-like protein [Amanita rubescens]
MPEGTMKAVYYHSPKNFEIKQVPIPKPLDDEVLLKGMCGTDAHIDAGEFISKFPLIPGHEVVGELIEMGKNVKGFSIGDRCVSDVGITVRHHPVHILYASYMRLNSADNCFYCRRGQSLLCENFESRGVTQDGGFAEYVVYKQHKVYKINNLTDEEATLLEPAACAVHGLDKLNPPVGGPTGLILAQLLKLNGASRVLADEYIEMDRQNPEAQWQKLKQDNPPTGVEKLANESINYVRRGGTLMIYGVYENKALVHWPPSKVRTLLIIGSFSQTFSFPRAVAYP